nr:MAG TPA: hypothetical protein [Caudoviricetes sp.]
MISGIVQIKENMSSCSTLMVHRRSGREKNRVIKF